MGQVAGRWVDAGELELSDDVRNADGFTGDVESLVVVSDQQWTYNLTVETAHTFFVGRQGWLVHNTCSRQIANGHAAEHIDEGFYDIGIYNTDGLADFIDDIMDSPDLNKSNLSRGRSAYWRFDPGDDFFGTLVIIDPKHADGGTVFRPTEGVDYFYDNLH